jgi:predicted enzyme related to lactoylglutathione lyase
MSSNNAHNHVSLIEFPATSPEELKTVTDFYAAAFEWHYKDWGGVYSDTSDSGVTTGVIAAEQRIRKAGGKIIVDTYAFPGGRRFHFTDPAGNELAVWSE